MSQKSIPGMFSDINLTVNLGANPKLITYEKALKDAIINLYHDPLISTITVIEWIPQIHVKFKLKYPLDKAIVFPFYAILQGYLWLNHSIVASSNIGCFSEISKQSALSIYRDLSGSLMSDIKKRSINDGDDWLPLINSIHGVNDDSVWKTIWDEIINLHKNN